MSIRRCVKAGPGKPAPAAPPVVEVLPPTDPAAFVAPPELIEVGARFAAGEYRACVEPIEALFFARRNTLHQGLLQYVVALMQLRRGMVRSPRRLLRQVLELWAPYPAWQEGVDVDAARSHAAALLERLPEGVVEVSGAAVDALWSPPPPLCGPPPTRPAGPCVPAGRTGG